MSVAFVGFGSDETKKRKTEFSHESNDDIGDNSSRSDTSVSEADVSEQNFAQEGNSKKRIKIPKSESEKSFFTVFQQDAIDAASQSIGTPMVTPTIPKKRGRPPKPESEKAKNNRPKGTIRVALGQKNSKTKVSRTETTPSNNDESSPFPLIQQTNSAKKSRGRPRIHPPKACEQDPSVKRPRGRPRTIALEGEQAWKNECGRLRRLVAKQTDLIAKLRQRLTDLGQPFEDCQLEMDIDQHNSQNQEKSKDANESSDEEEEGSLILEASNIEDTHQTYVGMFVDRENREDKGDSDDSDNSSV